MSFRVTQAPTAGGLVAHVLEGLASGALATGEGLVRLSPGERGQWTFSIEVGRT